MTKQKTGRKENFDKWFESVKWNLTCEYMDYLWLDTELSQNKHWYQLWRIFENYVEKASGGSKELMESYQEAEYVAGDIILDAHDKTRDELDWNLQMERYMNSNKC